MSRIRECAIARLEISAIKSDWWGSLSQDEQKDYIKKHPKSKYAKNQSSKPSKKPVSKTGLGKSSYAEWERDVTDIIAEEMGLPTRTHKDSWKLRKIPAC